jgi:hypothetical protein
MLSILRSLDIQRCPYNCGCIRCNVKQNVQMHNRMSRGTEQVSARSFNVREMLFPCPLCSKVSEAERTFRKTYSESCTAYTQDHISS